jgi:hypothetical protein
LANVGAGFFGLVVGWICYRTLRRRGGQAEISDIAAVIAAVGGGSVTALFNDDAELFGAYAIGLAVGFFGYLLAALALGGRKEVDEWMGD